MEQQARAVKFSVLIPVYNVQNYLEACVESVLNQSMDDFEIILVDDGSSDDSGMICDRYAAAYENVRAYHKANGGQLHTREYAISKAKGKYYVFLDSDDTLRQNALEILSEKFQEYDCDCVIFQLERMREGVVVSNASRFADICIEEKGALYKKCFMSNAYNSMCIKAVKATVFETDTDYTAFYHIRFGEDLLQSLQVLKNSRSVVFIDDVLYNYTVNPTSVTQSSRYDNYKIDFTVRAHVAAFLKQSGVWDEATFSTYKGYCIELFCEEVRRVCGFEVSYRNKKRLLKMLRNETYYQEFLSREKAVLKKEFLYRIIFELFRIRWDAALIIGSSLYRILKRTSCNESRTGK